MNFPYINHLLYLRKNFPYLDYFNRYLQAKELETQSLDLRAIFYSDTSNLAYQILWQNSRRLRDRGQGFRSLDAHTIRCKALFGMLTALNDVVSDTAKKAFAERLICAEPKAVFDMYKVLCYYLEWLTNFPGNLFLQKEISEVAKEVAEKVRGTSLPEKLTAAQISLMSRQSEGSGFVAEDQLHHELISMNDYIRKDDKIVTDAIDDEMVVRDMMKYLQVKMNWLEHKAAKVIDEIAEQDVREILTYLNTDILQKFKEKSLDYNSFTYAKTCKCLIVGGSSTFHEFIQPLILAMSSNEKSKIFNYVRIYVLSNSKDLSPLATYLSKKDHIYQRMIYLPSVVLPMFPINADKHQLEYQSRVKRNIDVLGGFFANEAKRLMSFEMLEDNIQTYLTEASHFLELYIYEIAERRPRQMGEREQEVKAIMQRRLEELCTQEERGGECMEESVPYHSDSDSEEGASGKTNLYQKMINQDRYDDETGRELPLDLRIPFHEDTGKQIYMFNNMEIGVDVHNRVKSMQGNKLGAGVRFLNLKIEATLMDSKGNIKTKRVHLENTFGRVQLANLEKPRNWYGPEPCPYMKYLELSMLDEEGYNVIASKPPTGEFSEAKAPYEALHLNLQVAQVKICAVNQEDKFYLLIDSNYYGPFKSIHVRPMHVIWKKHLFLPIMHFTPFSELSY